MTINGYQVKEFGPLDFEHVTLETRHESAVLREYCVNCGASHDVHPGIWSCDYCGSVNHADLGV